MTCLKEFGQAPSHQSFWERDMQQKRMESFDKISTNKLKPDTEMIEARIKYLSHIDEG
jgi:hypothetical protein